MLKAVYHEFSHVLRWDGPAYCGSLGAALESEGLAQVFVHEMMDCPPEAWEGMPPGVDLRALCLQADAAFDATGYDREAWFLAGGEWPDGVGYALGRLLVARVLAERPVQTAMTLAVAPAAGFRAALMPPPVTRVAGEGHPP